VAPQRAGMRLSVPYIVGGASQKLYGCNGSSVWEFHADPSPLGRSNDSSCIYALRCLSRDGKSVAPRNMKHTALPFGRRFCFNSMMFLDNSDRLGA